MRIFSRDVAKTALCSHARTHTRTSVGYMNSNKHYIGYMAVSNLDYPDTTTSTTPTRAEAFGGSARRVDAVPDLIGMASQSAGKEQWGLGVEG